MGVNYIKKSISQALSVFLLLSLCAPASAASLSGFEKKLDYKEGQFVDISATSTWAANVRTVYEFGIMNGKTSSEFQPNGN
ncbi:MAG: S-layer homology domain-containing protein, partial [Dysosmobacter sp.]|nr:S-layer homology domain-containing protein [Dysosmobacter sp.]